MIIISVSFLLFFTFLFMNLFITLVMSLDYDLVKEDILDLGINSDLNSITISSKIENAEINRIPYMLALEDRNEKDNNLAVRIKGDKKIDFFLIMNLLK